MIIPRSRCIRSRWREYMKFVDAGDWAGVAELMLSSAEKLAKGAPTF